MKQQKSAKQIGEKERRQRQLQTILSTLNLLLSLLYLLLALHGAQRRDDD